MFFSWHVTIRGFLQICKWKGSLFLRHFKTDLIGWSKMFLMTFQFSLLKKKLYKMFSISNFRYMAKRLQTSMTMFFWALEILHIFKLLSCKKTLCNRHFVRPRILVKLASYKLSLFTCCPPWLSRQTQLVECKFD